jgi:DNA recombination protein RmuC
MELVVVIALIVLAVGVFLGVRTIVAAINARPETAPVVAAAPQIDLDALVMSVRSSVEAQVRQTVAEAQRVAASQSQEFFKSQAQVLEEQTKNILTPFQSQVQQLAASVDSLRSTYDNEQGVIQSLAQQITTLQNSTNSLATALKSPTARGSWGENQLRNIIQMAGMEPYCDYIEQFTGGESERNQRPDVVVRLPNGAFLAVDSKAPRVEYLRMQEESDSTQRELALKAHVRAIQDHVKTLADKKYWEQFPQAPDFVVMFIPFESAVSDALRAEPSLLESAMRQRVLIASPVNLLAVLLAVAKGWQAHSVAEHAAKVAKLGDELYSRVGVVLDKVTKVGNGLKTANTAYNDMVGSIESRMLVTLRQFKGLGVVQGDDLDEVKALEITPRELNAAERSPELGA